MRRTAILLAVFVAAASGARAQDTGDSCVTCHTALPDQLGAPVAGMQSDVHAKHGLSCADCHGGDPQTMDLTAMAPEHGYRGKPKPRDIPDFCGRCHSDAEFMRRYNPSLATNQRERYQTSVHGKRLAAGDEKVATCISCHGVHGIKPGRLADSPVYPANIPATCGACHSQPDYMAAYGIPTDQEARYRRSVHGELLLQKRDMSAPVCTTCHDNHGASPPGLTTIAAVCGQCHVNNADFFVASPHKPAFDRLKLPECVTCHGNHEIHRTSDTMLGVDDQAVCVRCHQSTSPGYQAALQMRRTIDQLTHAREVAGTALQQAEALGMEVSDAAYELRDSRSLLVQARTSIHRFSPDKVAEVAAPGLEVAQRTERIATAAVAEAYTRRRNLLIPLAVIAVLMILLALKLRRLEQTPRDDR